MVPLVRSAFILVLLWKVAGTTAAAADPFIGMAQVTRSDGLKLYVLTGTHRDRAKCEKLLPELVDKAVIQAPGRGVTAKIDSTVCDTSPPPRSEFAALRGEAQATHTIFFTENFRAMPVHPRGAREDERKACEHLRQQVLIRFGVNGECLAPGK